MEEKIQELEERIGQLEKEMRAAFWGVLIVSGFVGAISVFILL